MTSHPTAVLVHGAFANASGFACLIRELFQAGYDALAPLLASTIRPTPYDAVGITGGPELLIDRAQFRETFCADVSVDLAATTAVSQRPLAAAAIGEPLSAHDWSTRPTWYQVSARDNAISPDAQRFTATRMNATISEIEGSQTAFIARPVRVAAFIARAHEATSR